MDTPYITDLPGSVLGSGGGRDSDGQVRTPSIRLRRDDDDATRERCVTAELFTQSVCPLVCRAS